MTCSTGTVLRRMSLLAVVLGGLLFALPAISGETPGYAGCPYINRGTWDLGTVMSNPDTVTETPNNEAKQTFTLKFSQAGPFDIQVMLYGAAGCDYLGGGGYVTFTGTYAPGVQGYINPKFVILGVTYAPPGPSSSTFVDYSNSNLVGTQTSLVNSFTNSNGYSVTLSGGAGIAKVINGTISSSISQTTTQKTTNSQTVALSVQVASGEKTQGTGSYFSPVDHDYDIIWVWLNPALVFTTNGDQVVWNGYGFDASDENGMDVVGVQLGYLNGDFGAIPADIQTSLNRAWAASQTYATGHGPALDTRDLGIIAAADPFSASTYGETYIGYVPPTPDTSDNRYTISLCSQANSFGYTQAAPSTAANVYTCTVTYANMSQEAQSLTNSYQLSYSTSVDLSANFLSFFSSEIRYSSSQILTWENMASAQLTSSSTSTATLSVQGPPCNNVNPGVGPCVPVYDASGTEPTQFEVYQDNLYGTFMFAPVHFY